MENQNAKDQNPNIVSISIATKWSSMTEILAKLIMPISSILLARILAPEVFGIVASINMVISFCDVFTDAGFQKYLIQRETSSDSNLDKISTVAFWTNLLISALIWCMVVLFSEPLAKLVGCEGHGVAVSISSFLLPLHALTSIPNARLKREMNFKALFIIRIATIITPFIVTLPLALYTRSFWALIIGSLAHDVVTVIITFYVTKWKPSIFYSFNILKEMFSFSFWSMLEAILVWLINWGDMFIVGIFLSPYYLGIYKTSINMINSIIAVISASITPVMLSALSRMQDNKNQYEETFYKISFFSGVLLIPMGIGMLVYKQTLCDILLGSAWSEGATLMGIWGLVSSIAILFNSYNGCVYISLGKPKVSAIIQLIQILLIIPTVYFSVQVDFIILSYARALIRIVGMLIHCIVVWYLFKISALNTIKKLVPCIVSAISMGMLGLLFVRCFSSLGIRIFSILICMIEYFGILYLFPSIRKIAHGYLTNLPKYR